MIPASSVSQDVAEAVLTHLRPLNIRYRIAGELRILVDGRCLVSARHTGSSEAALERVDIQLDGHEVQFGVVLFEDVERQLFAARPHFLLQAHAHYGHRDVTHYGTTGFHARRFAGLATPGHQEWTR